SADAVKASAGLGAAGAADLRDLCARLSAPRVIWIMVPSGKPVDDTIEALAPHLARGDVLIDGGNSNYKDSARRAAGLRARGIELIDSGTSGGIWGLENGYCLMVGGTREAVARCEPVFRTLAPPDGFAHVGPSGAGHFVKMIHNGIEYAMLEAYAEGYELLAAKKEYALDLRKIAGPSGPVRAGPCTMVILGAAGDLTRRKLLPSLLHLEADGALHEEFAVVGVGREPLSDEAFRDQVRATLGASGGLWQQFAP